MKFLFTGITQLLKNKKFYLLLFIIVYVFANYFFHLAVGNFVTHFHQTPFGNIRPRDFAFPIAKILFVLVAIYVIYRFITGEDRVRSTVFWAILIIYMLIVDKHLMLHPVEIAHYFQYGILAVLIGKYTDPERKQFKYIFVFFLSAIIGLGDEISQYFYHCPAYCRFFDYTDVLLNVLAAAGGSLLYYGFRKQESQNKIIKPFYKYLSFRIVLSVCFLILILNLFGILRFTTDVPVPPGGILKTDGGFAIVLEREVGVFGSWQKTFHTGLFYVLTPAEGTILNLLTFILFAAFDRNFLKYFYNLKNSIKNGEKGHEKEKTE